MAFLSLAGRPLGAMALGVAAAALASCSRPQSPPKPPPPAVPAAPQSAPASANPVLSRADLIAAARAARDAYARGAPYPAANTELVGRRFSLRLPFGCTDAVSSEDDARVEVDSTRGSLTITAQPQVWTGAPWLSPIVGRDPPVEAVEGFWVRHPWTTSELCPSTPAPLPAPVAAPGSPPAAPAAAPVETLGLAHIYRTGDTRLKRHARHPYRLVLKLTDDRIPLDHRFWLVVEGRLASLDGGEGKGQPIRCSAPTADRRPVCLMGVEIDRVAVQAQATGETLADWPG